MTVPEAQLVAVRLATRSRNQAQAKFLTKDLSWKAALVAALEGGASARDVGAAAGISHVRVLAIRDDQRKALEVAEKNRASLAAWAADADQDPR